VFSTKTDGSNEIALAAPDVNLYLAIYAMLTTHKSEGKLQLPKSYAEAVQSYLEIVKESKNPQVDNYYLKVFEHELKELEDNYSDWEATRVY